MKALQVPTFWTEYNQTSCLMQKRGHRVSLDWNSWAAENQRFRLQEAPLNFYPSVREKQGSLQSTSISHKENKSSLFCRHAAKLKWMALAPVILLLSNSLSVSLTLVITTAVCFRRGVWWNRSPLQALHRVLTHMLWRLLLHLLRWARTSGLNLGMSGLYLGLKMIHFVFQHWQ